MRLSRDLPARGRECYTRALPVPQPPRYLIACEDRVPKKPDSKTPPGEHQALRAENEALRDRLAALERELSHARQGDSNDPQEDQGATDAALGILQDVARVFTALPRLADAFEALLAAVCRFPEIDSGGVLLLEEKEKCFKLIAHQGIGPDFVQAISRVPFPSPHGKALLKGIPLQGRVADQDPSVFAPEISRPGGGSAILGSCRLRNRADS